MIETIDAVGETRDERRSAELHEMVETLLGLLEALDKATRRLAGLVRARLEAASRGDPDLRERSLEAERDALTDLALIERERVACLSEIGLTLGHRRPARLRLAELVLHVSPLQRDALLDLRESLRDLADEIDLLGAASPSFHRHRFGRICLYFARDAAPARLVDDAPWGSVHGVPAVDLDDAASGA